jgi:hypothetical protein
MKLAIMQPYFCPYIGYFQLVNAVDTFVFYDDVQYIKRGYINRNTLKNDLKFTVPVSNASTKRQICEVEINWENEFFDKFGKTIQHLYSKTLNTHAISDLLHSVFDRKPRTISELAMDSVKTFSDYMGVETQFLKSSELEYDKTDDRALNLMNICKSQSCSHYINSIGGRKLYDKDFFKENGIKLDFIKTSPSLSIIDLAMEHTKSDLSVMLEDYELV